MNMNRPMLVMVLASGVVACSSACAQTAVDEMKTRDGVQGLFEIREAAQDFVAAYNDRKRKNWVALEPDLRIFVPACLEPLKVRWKGRTDKTPYPVTLVTCSKSNPAFASARPWAVEVPVLIPKSK